MRRLRGISILLMSMLIVLGAIFLINFNEVHAADTKTLNIQRERPYNDDNGDGTAGNDRYNLKRNGKTYFVVKIFENDLITIGDSFPDAFYCLRGGLGFGSDERNPGSPIEYTRVGDMIKDRETVYAKYKDIIRAHKYSQNPPQGPIDIDDTELNKNYNSILWIIDNMYLPKHVNTEDATKTDTERAEMKEKLLRAAGIWTDAQPNTVLTDDDIEVIQQVALWQYTNADEADDTTSVYLPTDALANLLKINEGGTNYGDVASTTGDISGDRSTQINDLYKYLVNTAKDKPAPETITEPAINVKDTKPRIVEKTLTPGGAYYVVGPFEITSTGDLDKVDLNLNDVLTYKLGSKTETIEIDNRTGRAFISDADGKSDRDKEIKDMINAGKFYIAINKSIYSSLPEFKLSIDYTYSYWKTKTAEFWEAGNDNQPVVLVEKEKISDSGSAEIQVENKEFDLSLRKFITKINENELTGELSRVPELNLNKLRSKAATTAAYSHAKEPVAVKQGDIVTYTIRVYNEGEIDGYAKQITDYLPEGLGFLQGYKANIENMWSLSELSENAKVIDLVGEDGLYKDEESVKNLTIEDFKDDITIESLKDVKIVGGKVPITTNILSRDALDAKSNLIKAYDSNMKQSDVVSGNNWQQTSEQGKTDGLYYRDIQVVCIVIAENSYSDIIRNIAEITEHQDENGNTITDRDSTPKNVDLDRYEFRTENSTYQEDDDDYEQLILKYFDLALRKFITKVDDKDITSRVPEVKMDEDGELTYVHPKEEAPVEVANGNVVTYTIRVYNEGTIAGYVEEIKDDMPEGLEFLPEHETNQKYNWKVDGDEVKSDYLSRANEVKLGLEEGTFEIQPFDRSKSISKDSPLNPDYRDVEIAFKVVEEETPENSGRIIINTAEISKDYNDYEMEDIDSIPNNNKDGEDDIDKEYIYVKYFDLSLVKWVSKAIVTVDGKTTTTNYNMPSDDPGSEYLVKIPLDKKKINSGTVKVAYTIKVINEGEIAGYVGELTDYIPEGMEFKKEDNPLWEKGTDNKITTRALEKTLLQPAKYEKDNRKPDGDFNRGIITNPKESTAQVEIVLTWKRSGENLGLKTNWAEISEDYNEYGSKDIDSKPGNNIPEEDDQDFALIILERTTGGSFIYIPVIGAVLSILASGVILIKKYVL